MGLDISIQQRLPGFDLNVSFSCEPDQLLCLIGPSGAGKTTIMRIIAGLDRPYRGVITHDNDTWVDTSRNIFMPSQKRNIGYVFQDYPLFPHLNVLKNVSFATRDLDLVCTLMKDFGIWDLRDRRPHEVSGGERQRIAICQALAKRPSIMLLDEPFSALDLITRKRLREKVKSLKSEHSIPVVHVTHDIPEALFLADDILPVVRGRILKKWMMQFILKDRSNILYQMSRQRTKKYKDHTNHIKVPA